MVSSVTNSASIKPFVMLVSRGKKLGKYKTIPYPIVSNVTAVSQLAAPAHN